VGTLAPGSSISAILTVKARAVGKGQVLLLDAVSTATDPNCPNNDCIAGSGFIQVVPVQARPTPTPTPTTSVPPAATVPLANTGPASRPLLALSVLLLITGTTLTLAARRRQAR